MRAPLSKFSHLWLQIGLVLLHLAFLKEVNSKPWNKYSAPFGWTLCSAEPAQYLYRLSCESAELKKKKTAQDHELMGVYH